MDKVIVITGPTAIGKTDISLEIAKKFNGEIINADASQFRRGLNIGTAKINLTNVDVKHHLIDIIDINDSFSIKDFQILGRTKIKEIIDNNKIPFIVGGSGLYINSLIGDYELDDTNRESQNLEEKYSSYDNISLHDLLKSLDYDSSLIIHPNNRRRVLRAIGRALEGSKISTSKKGDNLLYDSLIIELTTSRDILYNRINKRFDFMIDEGWLDEITFLQSNNIDTFKIKDIGYNELSNYLAGNISFEEAKETVKKKTRNYAKRQITWFNNKMNTVKVAMDYDDIENTTISIINLVNDFFKKTSI